MVMLWGLAVLRVLIDQVINGIAFGQAFFRLMNGNARDAFLAVNVFGVDRRTPHRLRRAGVHRNFFAPCPLADQACIAGGLIQVNVTGNSGQRADLQLIGRSHGQQQGNHVVVTRIGVDDQVDFFRSVGACSN